MFETFYQTHVGNRKHHVFVTHWSWSDSSVHVDGHRTGPERDAIIRRLRPNLPYSYPVVM